QSVDEVIDSKDINKIKEKRALLQVKYDELSSAIKDIDQALSELDTIQKTPLVKLVTLKDTIFKSYINLQGNVETNQNVIISPEASGLLTQVLVRKGQSVGKGQILARIDDSGFSAQVAQAQYQLDLAKTTYERQKNLWDQKIGSEIQFLQAKTAMNSAQKAVDNIKSYLNKTVIRAPFSGTIDDVITEKGQVVGPGSQIFRIVNIGNMHVEANVPETFLQSLNIGANVQVKIPAINKQYLGKIKLISKYINPNNRTISVEVAVPNPDNLLRPNQVAILNIEDYVNQKAIIIKNENMIEKADGSKVVFVAQNVKDKVAIVKMISLELGKKKGDSYEVKSGLNTGDLLVTEGVRNLKDGIKVEIVE
ncbi:MAG: efflux RND transporter periplasmic adaptor subunit, partial [Flavobacterium sp.]